MTHIALIHGLSGSAKDMQYIANNMLKAGYRVTNINLPGHGTKPEDLLNIEMHDWVNAVETVMNVIQDEVFIIGQSMGALLALYYSANHQEKVKGLVLLSPAIRLHGILNRFFISLLYIYSLFFPLPHIYYKKNRGADIADPEVKKEYDAYNMIPLKALIEFERLRRATIKKLSLIEVPLLIIYSKKDHTIATNVVEIIDKRIRSTIREKKLLNNSFHVISVDVDKEDIVNTIFDFQRLIGMGVK